MTAEALTVRSLSPRPGAQEGITERFNPIECLDGRARGRAATVEPPAAGRYVAVQGPDRALLIPLGEEVVHVGRGLAADLRLDENSVSRRHAIIVPTPDGARILDDRSSNGTLVNGTRVQQAALSDGDEITLGRVVLRYIEL
ncbi:MAG TPA: FHA domain-containing protein [Solirubrobacteraceae bacterium]|nr:FHA domain-containing protein [Solirubrobacteraceae bacterium]